MQPNFEALIPELSRWNEGRGIDVAAWISCIGNFEHLIGYLELIWPEFVEHEGCVLRAGFSAESFRGFMDHTGGNKRSVEAVINHVHIVRIFGDSDLSPTEGQVIHIGRKLKDIWTCKLARDFPDREVTVSFPEGPFEDLTDFEITCFQSSHDHAAS